MSMIRRTSPFGELLSLRQAMDRLFEDSFVSPTSDGSSTRRVESAARNGSDSDAR